MHDRRTVIGIREHRRHPQPASGTRRPVVASLLDDEARVPPFISLGDVETWLAGLEEAEQSLAQSIAMAHQVRRAFLEAAPEVHDAEHPLCEPLSDSETRVLRYLPTNLSMREIAGELYVSMNTIKTHFRRIYAKLGVNSRSEAVDCARELGLLAARDRRAS
jgi:DNA-binding NarL/FixJ family response regulator